jgi:DNA-binding transcriptional MocR family regulator
VREARRTYARRRQALLDALRTRQIGSPTRSGFNVWVPVPREADVVTALQGAGWAVAPGEAFRLDSPPGIRVTTSTLSVREAETFAEDLAGALRPRSRTYSG